MTKHTRAPCSFCGKRSNAIYKGKSASACICRDCVLLLSDAIRSGGSGPQDAIQDLGFISAEDVERYTKELTDPEEPE